MKQKLMLCLLMAGGFYLTTNAQIQKGKWIGGLNLNGYNRVTKDVIPTTRDATYKDKMFNSQVTIGKMLNKHWLLGVGLTYENFGSLSRDPFMSSPPQKFRLNNYGPIIEVGYFSELAKNLYLRNSFTAAYLIKKSLTKQDYDLPTERDFRQDGSSVRGVLTPLKIDYVFKNRYLIGLSLVNINYNFRRTNTGTNTSPAYATESLFSYSLNPLENGISFSYIF
jgi:hypothetical protein